MPHPYWKVRKMATIAKKVANTKRLAYFSLAAILATVATLYTIQYGGDIIGKVYFALAVPSNNTKI